MFVYHMKYCVGYTTGSQLCSMIARKNLFLCPYECFDRSCGYFDYFKK